MRPHSITEALENWAKVTPSNIALAWNKERWSYHYLNQQVNRLANTFGNSGNVKSKFVWGCLGKTPELIVTFLAAAKVGLVYVPVNPKHGPRDLAPILHSARPSCVIAASECLETVLFTLKSEGLTNEVSIIECSSKRKSTKKTGWHEIISGARSSRPNVSIQLSEPIYLNYTSGTTGLPKGAITTHENIFWNSMSAINVLKLSRSDIHLCAFPAHIHPHEIFSRSLYLGGSVVLAEPEMDQIWKAINDNNVTCMMANPSLYVLFDQHVKRRKKEFGGLRVAESGGSITPSALIKTFKHSFDSHMVPVWGSTETTGIAIAAYDYPEDPKEGFLGNACPFYDLTVINDRKDPAKPGEVGQLVVRGPGVTQGYFGAAGENERKFYHGSYLTGDLVVRDTDNRFYFQSRINDMIKVAGLKVYPKEVEAVLILHPKISDVAVIGKPNGIRGEEIHAFIVLKKGEKLKVIDVIQFCRTKLEDYKLPRHFSFVASLPRNQSGKVDRAELRRRATIND
jgi:long-chain acyl-CoA synthetase